MRVGQTFPTGFEASGAVAYDVFSGPVHAGNRGAAPDGIDKPIPSVSNLWIRAALERIIALKQDWDGYDADPIRAPVILAMRAQMVSLLPPDCRPGHIVPGADGSLQAEWHFDGMSMGFIVESDLRVGCWTKTPEGLHYVEGWSAIEMFRALAQLRLSMR